MSLRPPSLADIVRLATGADQLDAEIAAEKASALGRSGQALAKAMAVLNAAEPGEARVELAYAAAEAAQAFFIQRELMGFRQHAEVVRDYGLTPEVLGKVGAKR